jgi:hypothetical protein
LERGSTARDGGDQCLFRCDLDQVAAGVVEDGGRYWSHLDRRSRLGSILARNGGRAISAKPRLQSFGWKKDIIGQRSIKTGPFFDYERLSRAAKH